MKNTKNVIYLKDYIRTKKSISTVQHYLGNESLLDPKPVLFKRIIAFIVDLLAVSVLKTSVHTAYALFINEFMGAIGTSFKIHLINASIGVHLSTFLSIYFSYFLFCTYILNGKTLGKYAMGLRIIKEDYFNNLQSTNYLLDFKDSFRRSLGYLFCYLSFGTFFIFNFSSEDKRGLPDYISGSRTVTDQWLYQMQDYKSHQQEQVSIDIAALQIAS